MTHTASVALQSFPAVHDVELQQFDDLGGTLILDSITLSGWVSGTVTGGLENLSTYEDKTLTASVDASITIDGQLAEYTAEAHDAQTFTLAPGEQINYEISDEGTTSATTTDPGVLASFVGDGFITYPVTSVIETTVSGPAPYVSTGVAVGEAEVTVSYEYHPAPTQTIAIYVYECVDGQQSTTPVVSTVADATAGISQAGPLLPTQVAAGVHETTAVVGPEWEFVECGQAGVTITDGQHASQPGTVPVGGHTDLYYYVTQAICYCDVTEYTYKRPLTVRVWKEIQGWAYESGQWVDKGDDGWYSLPESFGAFHDWDVTHLDEGPAWLPPGVYAGNPTATYRYKVSEGTPLTWEYSNVWSETPPTEPDPAPNGFGWVVDQTRTIQVEVPCV
ncbi:choice-of-anchor E domain-containing protein [Antribacter gilvus]|uniref:choice-of-anchor E domain-containing protein n=1 Tax=Antribacter gilvus TaxID=2304675 RepID=UPI0013DFB93C|nr:choice-of-anchor E domain-containing protein [Antribacter gilvus]